MIGAVTSTDTDRVIDDLFHIERGSEFDAQLNSCSSRRLMPCVATPHHADRTPVENTYAGH